MPPTDPYTAIPQLLYRYGEAIDQGRLEDAAAMFRHARIHTGRSQPLNADELLALWQRILVIYPCGTLRTRHLITNPIIELDADGTRASCRSCYTVLQATEQLPLQVIVSGRYHDQFALIDGEWCFTERDYRQMDLVGELSAHLKK
ncbi:MAG: nuclear transport factor 2 family protein [Thauera sp.]|jgi:3-phenylpropionate/cinnamic acid dioxygenase small subunit|nr:nuclear transport factor 2 family protein [Thauera sp.]